MSDRNRHAPLRLQGAWSHLTLDSIADTASHARPGRRAFTDAPDRASFTDGLPRSLSAGDLGRNVDVFARKIATLGLKSGDRVLVLMPNIVEGVTALLGVMRAGLTPCPISVVSSQAQIQAAAERVRAGGVVTVARYAHLSPAKTACEAASRYYGIRFVAAFGEAMPPGAISLDNWPDSDISTETLAAPQPHQEALITFDSHGLGEAHVRTHAQLISEALALSAITGLTSRGQLLGTFTPVSAAGVIATLAAPLISGAHVHLHGPFSPDTLATQLNESPEAILILPSAVEQAVLGLARGRVRDTIIINREPGLGKAAPSPGRVTELLALGEWATWALLRDPERRKLRLPRAYSHPVTTALPRSDILIHADASSSGHLTVSGPGLALPDIEGVAPTAFQSAWSARGDGPQHLVVAAEAPDAAEGAVAETMAA